MKRLWCSDLIGVLPVNPRMGIEKNFRKICPGHEAMETYGYPPEQWRTWSVKLTW